MRQSKRQAQVCEPVVISSNEDVGEVCNLEKDMKILIFRYLSLEYSLCLLFIITMHFLLLQKQTNMSDCGVFAIAFAMAICNRQWPELLCFDITKAEALVQLSGGWANASLSSISPAKTP